MIRLMAGLAALAACPVFAQAPAAPPSFDAASVKVSHTAARLGQETGGPGTNDPGRYRAAGVVMLSLLMTAYGVPYDQIPGGPAWIRDDLGPNRYDVDATVPRGTTKEQFQRMMQNLLAQRFHLVAHHEVQKFPGYDLVVAKGGPKLKEVAPDPNPAAIPPGPLVYGEDGFPILPRGPHTARIPSGGNLRLKYQERSIADLVAGLGLMISQSQADSPSPAVAAKRPRVIDKTGLTGKYDFTLEFACPGCPPVAVPVSAARAPTGSWDAPPAPEPTGGGPDLFVALEKQLGLRLEKARDVPVDVIVIDSVDKIPTEN